MSSTRSRPWRGSSSSSCARARAREADRGDSPGVEGPAVDPHLYAVFDRFDDDHWWFRGRRAVIRGVLRKRLPRAGGIAILDVGCGTGGMLALLSEFGQVEGLEHSPEAVARAAKRAAGAAIHRGGLPGGLPPGRTWDLITAFDVLEHLAEPVTALEAVRGALRKDGRFLCTVPAYAFLWSRHDEANLHVRRYTRPRLAGELEAAGFRVTWSTYFNTLLFPAVALTRIAGRFLPGREVKSDFKAGWRPLNRLLESVMSAERHLAPRVRLPFGVSILALARRVAPGDRR